MATYSLPLGSRDPASFDAGDVHAHLAAAGLTVQGVSVLADGSVEVEASGDPATAWGAFAPVRLSPLTLEELAEAVLGGNAEKAALRDRLDAVKARRGAAS